MRPAAGISYVRLVPLLLLNFAVEMIQETRHIDFHLPTGWNQCTTDELEVIAAAIALDTLRADRYHPFDMQAVKLKILLGINHLQVIEHIGDSSGVNTSLSHTEPSPADDAYLVRLMGVGRSWWHRLFKRQPQEEPFEITAEQLYSMTESHLAWLDDEKAEPLMRVPYPTLKIGRKTLDGPTPYLDGYTWQQYRYLQDWMQEYIKYTNAISRMQRRDTAKLAELAMKAAQAEAEFLAVLFQRSGRNNGITESRNNDTLDAALFAGFDPVKWQVILFWWSGLMRYLQKKYPRCFKPEKPGKRQRRSNPLELYVRTTATMEKYIGLNEEEVNRQSFHVILQHLDDMAREAEEMERLNKKYKSKH